MFRLFRLLLFYLIWTRRFQISVVTGTIYGFKGWREKRYSPALYEVFLCWMGVFLVICGSLFFIHFQNTEVIRVFRAFLAFKFFEDRSVICILCPYGNFKRQKILVILVINCVNTFPKDPIYSSYLFYADNHTSVITAWSNVYILWVLAIVYNHNLICLLYIVSSYIWTQTQSDQFVIFCLTI